MPDICVGQGIAIGKTIKGPCNGPGSQPISLDEAAKLIEEAVDKSPSVSLVPGIWWDLEIGSIANCTHCVPGPHFEIMPGGKRRP